MHLVDLSRSTQLARTTIRALLDTDETSAARRGPTLESVQKLADALGVPLSILVMTPNDWRVMVAACTAYGDNLQLARTRVRGGIGEASMALEILEEFGIHPDRNLDENPTPEKRKTLENINEVRRRTTLALGALAQMSAGGSSAKAAEMTALAAALGAAIANQYTAAVFATKTTNHD